MMNSLGAKTPPDTMFSKIRLEKDAEVDDVSKQVAETELRETPERTAEAVAELQKLLKENPDLNFDDSEKFLIMFLRPCKFYPESALALMKRIAEFRKKYAENLKDVSPISEQENFLKTKVVNVLVDRDQCRRRILIMNIGSAWNPDELDTDKLFRLLYLIHFGAMMEPWTQIHGAIIIMDFSGLGRKQAFAFTPAFSLRLLSFIQKAMPLRLKAVHIVNEPFIFNVIWTMFKPFIEEKLKKRIFFHGSKKGSLLKHINAECLPADYGGSLPKIDYCSADWYPIVAEYDDQIKSKTRGQPPTA